MLTEPLPIETFVQIKFNDIQVSQAMENWRVEPGKVQQVIIAYFREMGIFAVMPNLESELFERIVFMLKNSPDILGMVHKAEEAELNRKASRHAES